MNIYIVIEVFPVKLWNEEFSIDILTSGIEFSGMFTVLGTFMEGIQGWKLSSLYYTDFDLVTCRLNMERAALPTA